MNWIARVISRKDATSSMWKYVGTQEHARNQVLSVYENKEMGNQAKREMGCKWGWKGDGNENKGEMLRRRARVDKGEKGAEERGSGCWKEQYMYPWQQGRRCIGQNPDDH